ncbi:MAG: hypothetical protein ACE5K7_07090, partial [Phycisphaerae bacterium]
MYARAWKLVLVGLVVVGLEVLAGAQQRTEFSLDIGSDHELSDPYFDGDEWFDPGDVYETNQPVQGPTNGFKDDATIFGQDPPPDPFVAGSQVPVGQGDPSWYPNWFDLDGHDQLDFELPRDLPSNPRILLADPLLPCQCVVVPDTLIFSYDDDGPPGWPANDVPVIVPPTYGTTLGQDELWSVPYPFVAAPSPLSDEVGVHASLRPNPDLAEADDDDVDSLDFAEYECRFWYFTADHEATWVDVAILALDPGDIYLGNPVAGGAPLLV